MRRRKHFLSLSKSVRRAMLQRIILAKRPKTRRKRIEETVKNAGNKKNNSLN
ncbi:MULTISPECIES: YdeI/OmpD-associated family protein [unclassified Saccharicrinis]|uniref:YdeI/OmpD-associated family protein n=1 Tax=unclassified Saccharicrinis TaxID=2646859 RepID=UPI003D343A10